MSGGRAVNQCDARNAGAHIGIESEGRCLRHPIEKDALCTKCYPIMMLGRDGERGSLGSEIRGLRAASTGLSAGTTAGSAAGLLEQWQSEFRPLLGKSVRW